jgi:hypothetical protein
MYVCVFECVYDFDLCAGHRRGRRGRGVRSSIWMFEDKRADVNDDDNGR